METGIVGLGKMGLNMARRLTEHGHRVVGTDLNPDSVRALEEGGGEGAGSAQELAAALERPRHIWIMVPQGDPVESTIQALVPHLEEGDAILEGGNSNYRDTVRRAEALARQGIHLVDVGTSGGIWGRSEGYSMMVGGNERAVERVRPLLESLAPGPELGWGHVGPAGAGHFVKMVHNGIEYGMMQAYAEGFAILEAKEEFDLDLHRVAEIWRHGSVVRSWLLDLIARALEDGQDLTGVRPYVQDSGEGRWTVQEAVDLDVPAPVITHSLIERLRSRVDDSYGNKLLNVLREQFGGHEVARERTP